jgi:hypothetical protein
LVPCDAIPQLLDERNPLLLQKALDALERAGVLVSRAIGTTREYEINPRYALRDELRALLTKALSFYPAGLRDELLITRKRPRRKAKPL